MSGERVPATIDGLIQWIRDQRQRSATLPLADLLRRNNVDVSRLSPQQVLDLACIDLIQRRRMGQTSPVEHYLRQFPVLRTRSSLLDLIDAELCVAAELGESSDVQTWTKRYPQLAEQIRDLVLLRCDRDLPAVNAGQAARSDQAVLVARGKRKVSAAGAEPLPRAPADRESMPARVGGYQIIKRIGNGAMGTVYQARQLSLDRFVALKTIRRQLANNASSLARFIREAYAAAQLTHHNVVQVYDFGEDHGLHFFSMEWVRGGSLDALVRRHGPLPPRVAAGYALQAARGLQFAHRHGMVHRDVKPANLLLSDDGVVKVADLGLVKIPELDDVPAPDSDRQPEAASVTEVTMQGTAVGTPAFMAPEQSEDATTVDPRADIYSLGCTLFYLLTGTAPAGEMSAGDLPQIQDGSSPRIEPPVPQSLGKILSRATATRAGDRYQQMDQMVSDLEAFLGAAAVGNFVPSNQQADLWESLAARFAVATARRRAAGPLLAVLCAGSLILTVAGALWGGMWLLSGIGMLTAALVTVTALSSHNGQSAIANRFRQWIGSWAITDLVSFVAGAVVFGSLLVITGAVIGLAAGCLLGVAAGAIYHFSVEVPSRARSAEMVARAETFIRDLRIEGAEEEAIRSFAAKHGGRRWMDLFESLFGYDALVAIRRRLAMDPSFTRLNKTGTLRDWICRQLESRAIANRKARDQRRLARIEQRGLQSQGLDKDAARRRGWQLAAAVVDSAQLGPAQSIHEETPEQKRQRIKAMLADARSGRYQRPPDRYARLKFWCSGYMRLLCGCVLLAAATLAARHSGLPQTLRGIEKIQWAWPPPPELANVLRDHGSIWSLAAAGLLLCMSAFVSGWRMTPFAVAATAVILLGPVWGIPQIGDDWFPWMVSVAVAILIYVPGVLFGETEAW